MTRININVPEAEAMLHCSIFNSWSNYEELVARFKESKNV